MFVLVIQTILLLAVAFILGCVIGCLLRRWLGAGETGSAQTTEKPAAEPKNEGTAAAAALAAQKASAPQTPIIPKPPMPAAPVPPVAPAAPKGSVSEKPAAKAAKPPAAKKATSPKKAAAKPASGEKDNLKQIKGIGPQNENRLNDLGIATFAQIASWTAKDEEHYGEALAFPGRIEREEWVKQAKVLAKGGETEFAARVEKGEVASSTGKASATSGSAKPKALAKARGGQPDDLTLIDGVGNAIEKKLNKLGIFHFVQLAEMSKEELTWLGETVGFPGRPERENWNGEAKTLAKGSAAPAAGRAKRGEIKSKRKN